MSNAGPLASLAALRDDLSKGELPLVFDVEWDGMDLCASMFCNDNGIPPERLNRDVFEALVSLRTVRDLTESPLFQTSAKRSAWNSLRNAFNTNVTRSFLTQGIIRPLVHPTVEENASACARADAFDVGVPAFSFKTLSEHPFFSACVSHKFLQFWIAPGGQLRFLCDLYDPLPENGQCEFGQFNARIRDAVTRRENATRDRLQRKLEAKVAKHARAEVEAQREKPTASVPRSSSDRADLQATEEKERMRIRKERSATERARREAAVWETTTTVVSRPPTKPAAKAKKNKSGRSSATAIGKKAESIELAMQHADALAERESKRVAEAEALYEVRRIGFAIQRGE